MSQLIVFLFLNCFTAPAQPVQAATAMTSQAGITFVAPPKTAHPQAPAAQKPAKKATGRFPATSDATSWGLPLAGLALITACLVVKKEADDAH